MTYWFTKYNSRELRRSLIHLIHRGIISDINVTPSSGNVVLPTDRRRLGWNLGQKFPSKTLEATLQAKVQFEEYNEKKQAPGTYEDPFCVGLNTYASVSTFRVFTSLLFIHLTETSVFKHFFLFLFTLGKPLSETLFFRGALLNFFVRGAKHIIVQMWLQLFWLL